VKKMTVQDYLRERSLFLSGESMIDNLDNHKLIVSGIAGRDIQECKC
jgi:hypothetical protein